MLPALSQLGCKLSVENIFLLDLICMLANFSNYWRSSFQVRILKFTIIFIVYAIRGGPCTIKISWVFEKYSQNEYFLLTDSSFHPLFADIWMDKKKSPERGPGNILTEISCFSDWNMSSFLLYFGKFFTKK